MILNSLLVALGGFFGAISRFAISNLVKKYHHSSFPLGTLLINLVGAFLLGFLNGKELNHVWMLLLGTGYMGAFTTFSTFKLENIQLQRDKKRFTSFIYMGVTYTCGVTLAFLGYLLGDFR